MSNGLQGEWMTKIFPILWAWPAGKTHWNRSAVTEIFGLNHTMSTGLAGEWATDIFQTVRILPIGNAHWDHIGSTKIFV